jgi:hypothetical protein
MRLFKLKKMLETIKPLSVKILSVSEDGEIYNIEVVSHSFESSPHSFQRLSMVQELTNHKDLDGHLDPYTIVYHLLTPAEQASKKEKI